jgi:hypothetical protein
MLKKIDPYTFIVAVVFIMMAIVFVISLPTLPPQLPLFYSKIGDDQMVDSWWIFLLPVLAIIFITANKIILSKYFKENILMEKVIYYTNLAIIVIAGFMFIRILLLVK